MATARPVTLALLGTGSRGRTFSSFAQRYPDRARVVAVADPRTDVEKMKALLDETANAVNQQPQGQIGCRAPGTMRNKLDAQRNRLLRRLAKIDRLCALLDENPAFPKFEEMLDLTRELI